MVSETNPFSFKDLFKEKMSKHEKMHQRTQVKEKNFQKYIKNTIDMCIFILKNYHTNNDYNDYVKFNYIYYKYMLVAFSLKYS